MWRSRARPLLLRSSPWIHSQIKSPVLPRTLTLTLAPLSSKCLPPPATTAAHFHHPSRLLSSLHEPQPQDESPSWNLHESDDPSLVSEQSLVPDGGMREGSVHGGDESASEAADGVLEVDEEQLDSVVALLRSDSEEPVEASLEKKEITVSEEFVVRVIQASNISAEKLVAFCTWALRNDASVRTASAVELLVHVVGGSEELGKKEAYALWDLVKELEEVKGLINTEILNELISMFWKLGKAKAGLEVFNKFEEFGCVPDGNSYYFVIQALGKRSMFDTASSICEKMLNSGRLPDGKKIGAIITFFCKGKNAEMAHSVYLMAKENKISPPRSSLDSLIKGLSKSDETVRIALELLEDYSSGANKYANQTFSSVIKGLCRIKDHKEAKRLLLGMVDSGPPPGNAAFNSVITALSKAGEMEDAVALMKVMDSRGLRPDVYTYTVIMSGYTKGGLMDEARKVFYEAKKRHGKLSPVTYHILTRGYCKMEEFDKALECLKEMKKDGVQPNTDEYNKMIQSLCLKALDWRTAEKLLEEVKESGLYLPGITRSLITAVKELEEEEIPLEEAKNEV